MYSQRFQANNSAFKHYYKASQNASVRLDIDTSPDSLQGLCTDGLNVCICLVIISQNGKRISLIHTDLAVTDAAIIRECEWVGPGSEMILIKGRLYNLPLMEQQCEINNKTLPRIKQALLSRPDLSIRFNTSRYSQPTWAVTISRQAKIQTYMDETMVSGHTMPGIELRHAINMVNDFSLILTHHFHDLDIQFDGTKWSPAPLLSVNAREWINRFQHQPNTISSPGFAEIIQAYLDHATIVERGEHPLKTAKLLFTVTEPKTIWFSNTLPTQGDSPRSVGITEFEAIIGGGFTYTENLHIRTGKTPNVKTQVDRNSPLHRKVMSCIAHPPTDKLMVCRMNDEVGHGVFARQPIAFGEIVAIYTGELQFKTESEDRSYCLNPGEFEQNEWQIDAKRIGGIARFFQHLPISNDVLADNLISQFQKDPAQIENYLHLVGELSSLSPTERIFCIQAIKDSLPQGDRVRGMLAYRQQKDMFHLPKLNIPQQNIAFANLEMGTITMESGKPAVYFFATRDIAVHELLGFSYGLGYWASMARLPLLFNKHGEMIPRKQYRYESMPFYLKVPSRSDHRVFFYSRKQYKADLAQRATSVHLAQGLHPLSFFQVRKQLANNNIVGKKHGRITDNSFVSKLKSLLPEDVDVELFEHMPSSAPPGEEFIFNVICRARTMQRWAQLVQLLRKNESIGKYCKALQMTKEVIIFGVNLYTQEMYRFIQSITNKSLKEYFMQEIPPHLCPRDLKEDDLVSKDGAGYKVLLGKR